MTHADKLREMIREADETATRETRARNKVTAIFFSGKVAALREALKVVEKGADA